MCLSIPLILTSIRLIAALCVIPVFCAYGLPLQSIYINCLLAGLFLALSITDFLDGYLARLYQQETELGRILDPLADKFLVYCTLVMLVYAHKLHFFWALIFIGREFFVMGLREIALTYNSKLTVITSAKLKTVLQVLAFAFVLLNPYQDQYTGSAFWWNSIEFLLLSVALALSLSSAYWYCKIFMTSVRIPHDLS